MSYVEKLTSHLKGFIYFNCFIEASFLFFTKNEKILREEKYNFKLKRPDRVLNVERLKFHSGLCSLLRSRPF